jgi:hypothetical protein
LSSLYQRARRSQSQHNHQWSRACSALYRIVEWKITDVRCDVVRWPSRIMESNSYSYTTELHCGRCRDIRPGLTIPTHTATHQWCHHSKRDTGAALAVGYRTVKCLLNTQNLLTECSIQFHFGYFTSANLPHTDQLITSEFHDLKKLGNPKESVKKMGSMAQRRWSCGVQQGKTIPVWA